MGPACGEKQPLSQSLPGQSHLKCHLCHGQPGGCVPTLPGEQWHVAVPQGLGTWWDGVLMGLGVAAGGFSAV